MGGLHLFQTPSEEVPPLITEVQELGVAKVFAAHCTGDDAIELLRAAYGEDFTEGGVGRTVTIAAQ